MKKHLITRHLMPIMLFVRQNIRRSFRSFVVKRIFVNTKIKPLNWCGKLNAKNLKKFVKLNSMAKCHENDAKNLPQPLVVRRPQMQCLSINLYKLRIQRQVSLKFELVVKFQNAMQFLSPTLSITPNDCVYV